MNKIIIFLVLVISANTSISQDYPPSGLTGLALHSWLKKNWYDGKFQALGYDDARHAMYDDIDQKNGNLVGVYGGYTQLFTPGGAFTTAFPITTEHTVPQSFFDYLEPMKSDIHHLFPEHNDVNVARSNYPFMEINDSITDKWWINTTYTISIPSVNKDNYSEEGVQSFEPREDHKGNVARAVFYFYTMYKNGVRTINDCGNINDLYDWHKTELVDADELDRNDDTEFYQGNRNPYIDYPELLGYAWGFTSSGTNPYLNFVETSTAIHPDLANGKSIKVDIEISPAPSNSESVTLIVDSESTLDVSSYSLSKTSFTIDSGSALQSFYVNLTGNAEGYLQLNLDGLSQNVSYGYNDAYLLYISKNLSLTEKFGEDLILKYANNTLFLNENNSTIEYEVLSIDGKKMESNRIINNSISFQSYPKGIYIIKLMTKDSFVAKKIIVQ